MAFWFWASEHGCERTVAILHLDKLSQLARATQHNAFLKKAATDTTVLGSSGMSPDFGGRLFITIIFPDTPTTSSSSCNYCITTATTTTNSKKTRRMQQSMRSPARLGGRGPSYCCRAVTTATTKPASTTRASNVAGNISFCGEDAHAARL